MADGGAPVRLSYDWRAGDFDAYLLLVRQMRATRGDPDGSRVVSLMFRAFALFFLPVSVTALLAVVWSLPGAQDVPDRVVDLVAVFIVVWGAGYVYFKTLHRVARRGDVAAMRRAFESRCGEVWAVTLDAQGFSVEGAASQGRYRWSDPPVACTLLAGHIVVIHPRMPLLIPLRALAGDPADLAARIEGWLRAPE